MAIDSKNLLVWVKAMSRGQALPLDASEVHGSMTEAEAYAATATAYAGQTIKVKMDDGKYHLYTLQPSTSGYTLEEVGAINETDLKQYVQVVDSLPTSGRVQGVLYIYSYTEGSGDTAVEKSEGSVWTGTEWRKVFWDITSDIAEKAPIKNPVFTGSVKVAIGEGNDRVDEEVALKSYVDDKIAAATMVQIMTWEDDD
jgi:hypothetical protein